MEFNLQEKGAHKVTIDSVVFKFLRVLKESRV